MNIEFTNEDKKTIHEMYRLCEQQIKSDITEFSAETTTPDNIFRHCDYQKEKIKKFYDLVFRISKMELEE